MSGTIKLQTGITHTNGNQSVPIAAKTKEITQTGQVVFVDTPTIATSATTISTGSISTLGVAMIENLDSANFIKLGMDVAGTPAYPFKIKAGERYPMRFVPGITIKAIADTAPVKIQVTIYED